MNPVSQSPEDRELAMRRARSLRLQQNAVAMAERRVRAETRAEIVKKMIARGNRDVSYLSDVSGLSQQQIEQLL